MWSLLKAYVIWGNNAFLHIQDTCTRAIGKIALFPVFIAFVILEDYTFLSVKARVKGEDCAFLLIKYVSNIKILPYFHSSNKYQTIFPIQRVFGILE